MKRGRRTDWTWVYMGYRATPDVQVNKRLVPASNRTPSTSSVVLYLTFRIADRRTDTLFALFKSDNKSCKKKAPSYSQATAAAAAAAAAGIYTPLPVPTIPLTSGSISVAHSFVNWKDTHNVNWLLHVRIRRWLVWHNALPLARQKKKLPVTVAITWHGVVK